MYSQQYSQHSIHSNKEYSQSDLEIATQCENTLQDPPFVSQIVSNTPSNRPKAWARLVRYHYLS